MEPKRAIVLVGHGAAPADYPRERLRRLKSLEAERTARGRGEMSDEEAALDREIRAWPRTPASDPYKSGLEELARALARRSGREVAAAYNEFCGPSLEDAVSALAAGGAARIEVATTMFTRGGIHSECEIPHAVGRLRERFPSVEIVYAWPYDADLAADFLARHLEGR